MLMILAVGFTFTPDLKWNSYMQFMAKTAGKRSVLCIAPELQLPYSNLLVRGHQK